MEEVRKNARRPAVLHVSSVGRLGSDAAPERSFCAPTVHVVAAGTCSPSRCPQREGAVRRSPQVTGPCHGPGVRVFGLAEGLVSLAGSHRGCVSANFGAVRMLPGAWF